MATTSKTTLFTTCKPFRRLDGHLQSVAMASWAEIGLDVVIVGDEPGAAEACQDFGFRHCPDVKRDKSGLPFIGALFETARCHVTTEFIAYVNADIALSLNARAMFAAYEQYSERKPAAMVSRRRNIAYPATWTPSDISCTLETTNTLVGTWDNGYSMDLFVWPTHLPLSPPDLVVGRMGWDTWMINELSRMGLAVIDGSDAQAVLHPLHGYANGVEGWLDYINGGSTLKNLAKIGRPKVRSIDDATTHVYRSGKGISAMTREPDPTPDYAVQPDRLLKTLLASVSLYRAFHADSSIPDLFRSLLWKTDRFLFLHPDLCPSIDTKYIETMNLSDKNANSAIDQLEDLLAAPTLTAITNKVSEGRHIVIRGAGSWANRLTQLLERHDIHVSGYEVPDASTGSINGKPANPPGYADKDAFYLIGSSMYSAVETEFRARNLRIFEDYLY